MPDIWAKQDDFLSKIVDLNNSASTFVTAAGTNLDALKAGMSSIGGACSACHKAYRQPES